jgi:ABC-type nitrate/sulfonate/bicarbonate transport system substrate-binding protein
MKPLSPSRIAIAFIALFAILLAGWFLAGMPYGTPPPAAALSPVVVAWSPFESTALVWVAEDQNYFPKHGLNVSFRRYDSGAGSLDGVMKGEADISVGVTEFPFVRKAFSETGIRALGTIDRGEFTYLVARKDRGIKNATSLTGKRVGTTVGTIAEFHLGRYLVLNGMSSRDITLVDVRTPDGWVNDLADGKLDAIATAQPYANSAAERLGDNAVAWSIQSSQPLYALVVSTDTWTAQHPGEAKEFLAALADAEDYTTMHPAEARAIVQKRLDLNASYMPTVWQQNRFSVTIDQSLVSTMEDEARWMMANNMTNATAMPDFRKFIHTKSLEEVKPGSVRIIG